MDSEKLELKTGNYHIYHVHFMNPGQIVKRPLAIKNGVLTILEERARPAKFHFEGKSSGEMEKAAPFKICVDKEFLAPRGGRVEANRHTPHHTWYIMRSIPSPAPIGNDMFMFYVDDPKPDTKAWWVPREIQPTATQVDLEASGFPWYIVMAKAD